jgi:hypothetical protein
MINTCLTESPIAGMKLKRYMPAILPWTNTPSIDLLATMPGTGIKLAIVYL